MGCLLEGRAGFYGEAQEDWVADPPWERVLATQESHLLPEGKKLLCLEFLLYWCKSFSCSIPALTYPFPGRGSAHACLAGEHHSSSRSGQALLAVKSLGIACRKCRMYSVSPADVKITCETRS